MNIVEHVSLLHGGESSGYMPRSGIAGSSRSDVLDIKPDTLKLIEKKLGKTLENIGAGGKFLNRTPIAYALRSRIDKWELIKLQSFCKAKDIIKRTNRQPTNWEKM